MIVIDGPAALDGELKVQGAKNSTLPLLAATVLCKGQTAVSYTHLDVYKRQALDGAHWAPAPHRRRGMSGAVKEYR